MVRTNRRNRDKSPYLHAGAVRIIGSLEREHSLTLRRGNISAGEERNLQATLSVIWNFSCVNSTSAIHLGEVRTWRCNFRADCKTAPSKMERGASADCQRETEMIFWQGILFAWDSLGRTAELQDSARWKRCILTSSPVGEISNVFFILYTKEAWMDSWSKISSIHSQESRVASRSINVRCMPIGLHFSPKVSVITEKI